MLLRGTLTLACLLFVAGLSCADDKPVFTDPADAGPDFEVQGEYVGEIERDGEKRKLGVHVIALGDGRFDVVAYPGGLPGDGWDGEDRRMAKGKTENGVTTFSGDDPEARGTLEDGVITVTSSDGTVIGSLKKTERQSPTAGARPPEGALVLFDGTTAEHFERGRMTEDGYLMVGCETKRKFGDHTLHVEFRTPFMPAHRGQQRGNSGVYIQNRYECQVLDSFGLEGRNNECGGIYQIADPKVNMCYPPLSWQTYDIDFTAARYNDAGEKTTNARVTIRHNGVVIHDDLELPRGTPGKNPEGPGPDGIYLQDHGDPVVYRNIWVVEKD